MRDPIFAGDYTTVYYHLPEAACRGKSTDLFFSQEPKEVRQAKRICRGCVERERCLEMAITNAEGGGVWGGVVFRRGKPDANDMEYWKRRRGQAEGEPGAVDDLDDPLVDEPGAAAKTAKPAKKKKDKKDKNGRSHDAGFSRYPMPTRTVLPPQPDKDR